MKNIKYKLLPFFIAIISSFSACKESEPDIKNIDLRYKTEDLYEIAAASATPIKIQVKSNEPWSVYSIHDWCTITPNNGLGGEIYTVEITFKDNESLEDRVDTITIKSDYWIGKKFVVHQKGIAYLTIDKSKDILLNKGIDHALLKIQSNQNWRSEVQKEVNWLKIVTDKNGKLDQTISIESLPNLGEQRECFIYLYDRKNIKSDSIKIIQEGVLLNVDISPLRIFHKSEVIKINVESNTKWTVSTENKADNWVSFNATSFEGNHELAITVDENNELSIRNSVIILSTQITEGITPIIKKISLKQAYKQRPTRYTFPMTDLKKKWKINYGNVSFNGDAHFVAGRCSKENFELGNYSFHLKTMTPDAMVQIFFAFLKPEWSEIRWWINGENKKTDINTLPWVEEGDTKDIPIDTNIPHTMGMNLTDDNGFIKIEWILDDKVLATHTANALKDKLLINANQKVEIFLGCDKGECVFDWYEYTPPFNWDE